MNFDYKEMWQELYDEFVSDNGREPTLKEIRDFEGDLMGSLIDNAEYYL